MNNYQPVLSQDEVVALLGRPLSEVEIKNFNISNPYLIYSIESIYPFNDLYHNRVSFKQFSASLY